MGLYRQVRKKGQGKIWGNDGDEVGKKEGRKERERLNVNMVKHMRTRVKCDQQANKQITWKSNLD